MDAEPTSKRSVIITALVIGLLTCGTCVGGGYWGLQRFKEAVEGSPEWSDDAIARDRVTPLFGLTLPATVLAMRSRSYGLQDRTYEVLVRLQPGDRQAWLEANHLGPSGDAATVDVEGLEAEIRRAATPRGAVRVTLFENLPRETGVPTIFRSATLLEYDDQCWVYLEAF